MTHKTCPKCYAEVAVVNGTARNLSRVYDNGAQYLRGAHYLTCDGDRVQADIRKRESAERNQRILARYHRLLKDAFEAGTLNADDASVKVLDAITRMAAKS